MLLEVRLVGENILFGIRRWEEVAW